MRQTIFATTLPETPKTGSTRQSRTLTATNVAPNLKNNASKVRSEREHLFRCRHGEHHKLVAVEVAEVGSVQVSGVFTSVPRATLIGAT